MKNFKYVVDVEDYKTARDFADAVYGSTADEYARRGSKNVDKVKEDCEIGKLGEMAVYHYLTTLGKIVTPVDFEVYGKKRKSFNPDLTSGNLTFAVKCQSQKSVNEYGESFLLQKSDKTLTTTNPNDKLVYCTFNGDLIEIKAIINMMDLVLEEPKVYQLRNTKHAVYMKTIREKVTNLWNLEESNGN